jgi:hypothetical protein
MLVTGSATTAVPTAVPTVVPACKQPAQVISQEPIKPTSVDLKALSARV